MKTSLYSLAAGALLALSTTAAVADPDFTRAELNDLIDLDRVMEIVEDRYPDARIVEAELDDDDGGQWEVKVITADDKKRELELDARSGELLHGGKGGRG